MATASPPKPWQREGRVTEAPKTEPTSVSVATTTSQTSSVPDLPERPRSLKATINRNASAYSPYGINPVGIAPNYPQMPAQYNNPYSRISGMRYPGMGGVYGMGGMGYGGMANRYNGIGGMGVDPNDPNSLTNGFTRNTQATFQMIENIVGAFGGLAQMLESTYMATHSSFFAMVSVAEQFGNLRNTLGSILGIFTILKWLRTLFAKLSGRPPPADAISLTPSAFAKFEGRKTLPDGTIIDLARPSKKPFFFFIAAAFGLPYLMGKLIQSLNASQEEEQHRLAVSGQLQTGPDGQLMPQYIDPSKLDFCRVLYDFNSETGANMDGVDLQVKKGDLVAVLSQSDPLGNPSEWWRCRARDGRIGYIPKVYLEVARKPGQLNVLKNKIIKRSDMSVHKNSSPVVESKAGGLSLESFQKSQFYS
ncbi:Peroxisomal membrane protein PAS20 [Erysiphe neolycopersici]|uniref:Peroxisomal membrane protein PEX13 n=1 Tax=Erysiphe neolycopersici TaxID=212602 RepID=A0A420HX98_9PEZI|nr:Peroxisomal membrane protein PAS20 [Erysiphe neolycopersici]